MNTRPKNSKWIIVSNRLPVDFNRKTGKFTQSTGGLVSALANADIVGEQCWVGYTDHPESLENHNELVPVTMDAELYDDYYNGMSNDVIWPLFHYETSYVDFQWKYWEAYQKANQIFAQKILSIARPGDVIWIHDYHLFLLPRYLRKKKPGLKIGFFLHIPFPSSEIFSSLPVRQELLAGVLDSNLIGFQGYDYLRHFSSSVYNIMGIDSDLHTIENEKYETHLGVFPVSINAKKFIKKKSTSVVQKYIDEYRQPGKKIILGVDRLDYIKGLDLKLAAFRELLVRHPEWRGRVHLLQLAVPSRIHVEDYINTKNEIERMVGQINGEFGQPGYAPINYLFASLPFEKLVALYRTADALYVSSKRDGMNLVCMEYIVSQGEDDPGVVLLSEFAGAASILSHTLAVNPWNITATADAMNSALKMDIKERCNRNTFMIDFLLKYDSSAWARVFLNKLAATGSARSKNLAQPIQVSRANRVILPREIKSALKSKRIILFIDFDGTLAPIISDPTAVKVDTKTSEILSRLSKKENVHGMVIVTGRDSKFIFNQFKNMYISIAAEHGANFYDRKFKKWISLGGGRPAWIPEIKTILEDYERRVPGSMLEQKKYALSWHYRNSPEKFAEYQARKLFVELESALSHQSADVLWGKKVIEVRTLEANKGHFARWYQSSFERISPEDNHYFLAIGDDKTDEDMFEAITEVGSSIRVGKAHTRADYYLEKQDQVIHLLNEIDAHLK